MVYLLLKYLQNAIDSFNHTWHSRNK